MPGERSAVRVSGLSDLRRDLKAISRDLPKELGGAMQRAAQPVARKASELATKGETGRYSRSIKARRQQSKAVVGSSLPYANVRHWGGTTGRGHKPGVPGSGSVKVKGDHAIEKAAEQQADAFINDLADGIERLLARHGFK